MGSTDQRPIDRLRATLLVLASLLLTSASVASTTTYQYDELGRLKSASSDTGAAVTYVIDGADNRTSIVTSKDTTPPSVPGGLSAIATSGTNVNLAWSSAADAGGASLGGYKIYRNGSLIATTVGSGTTYSDATVVGSSTYQYKVASYDTAIPPNVSGQSAGVNISTPDVTPPSVPTALSTSVIAWNRIDLSWTASSDNVGGTGVAGYRIYRDGTLLTTTATTTYADTGVVGSHTYSYSVAAYDAASPANASAQTVAVQATTPPAPDATPPSIPTGLSASAPSSTQVNVSWNASTDTGGSGLAGYKIYRGGSLLTTLTGVATTYSDTSVVGTTNYSYTVSAYDGATNTSAQSGSASVTTPDTIAPTVPSSLSASAVSPTQVNLTWTGSSDSGGSGLAGYRIYRGGTQIATSGTTSFSDTTAAAGTSYSYTVAAYDNATNVSGQSNTASVTTPSPLSASINMTVWSWFQQSNFPASVSPNVVATPTGGSGGYTYAWQRVSGDTVAIAKTPSVSSTGFSRTVPTFFTDYTSVWRCLVTDSAGHTTYTPTVTVTFRRENTN